jgi:hypothetical protein
MLEAIAFWTAHPPHDAIDIAARLLGSTPLLTQGGTFKNHHVWRIGYAPDFDIAGVEQQIRRELDEIGWLFVTTGGRGEKKGETVLLFALAPILPKTVTVGYHATRACLIPRICGEDGEGLLPSNAERQATNFPDTAGVIHVCEKLTHNGDENDSAEWWRVTLSQKNRFNDPNWGIVRIDMTQLPAGARVYQDMHSASGVVVDRINRIPGRLISEVSGQESAVPVASRVTGVNTSLPQQHELGD